MTPVQRVLERLAGIKRTRRGWTARCPGPVHSRGDKRPSLDIEERGGVALLICRTGDTLDEILRALGLERRDLFPAKGGGPLPARETPRPRRRSALDEARAAVLRAARGEAWARPGVSELYQASAVICAAWRGIQRTRDEATRRGPTRGVWLRLAEAAARETRLHRLELEYDDALAAVRFRAFFGRDEPHHAQRRA